MNNYEKIRNILSKHLYNHGDVQINDGNVYRAVIDAMDEVLQSNNEFIPVNEQKPPDNVELLAKSPTGTIHLTSWRNGYNIFSCQEKTANSYDWSWKLI